MNAKITFKHRDYTGIATWDEEARTIVGSIRGIRDDIGFSGVDLQSAYARFSSSVDAYLKLCEKVDEEPGAASHTKQLVGLLAMLAGLLATVLCSVMILGIAIDPSLEARSRISFIGFIIGETLGIASMIGGVRAIHSRRAPLLYPHPKG